MGSAVAGNWMIYEEQFFGGMSETMEQNTVIFNGASRGALNLVARRHRGNYEQESFMRQMANLVSRRDTTAVDTAIPDIPLIQDETVAVKSNLKIGPASVTADAIKKIQADPGVFSFTMGVQTGPSVLVEFANTGIATLVGAISSQPALVNDVSAVGTGLIDNSNLISTVAQFGDAGTRIVAWVMHSKPFYNLMEHQVANGTNLFNIPGLTVQAGEPGVPGLGRPIIITDSPSLVIAGTPNNYMTLGLTADALEAMESEERTIWTDQITGEEQLKIRIQGELAVTYKAKGYKYLTASGINPTAAALATPANWQMVSTDIKSTAGCILRTQ